MKIHFQSLFATEFLCQISGQTSCLVSHFYLPLVPFCLKIFDSVTINYLSISKERENGKTKWVISKAISLRK